MAADFTLAHLRALADESALREYIDGPVPTAMLRDVLDALDAAQRSAAQSAAAAVDAARDLGHVVATERAQREAAEGECARLRTEIARASGSGAVVPLDLDARVRAVARDAVRAIIADPTRAREVLSLVLVGRVHVSQPVARGPVWLTAEAQPGALLRQSDAGYIDDTNGKRSYPATATVRLRRQVA